MGSNSDKTKLGVVGTTIGLMTLGALGMSSNVDTNTVNNQINQNISIVQEYEEEGEKVSQPQSNIISDITVEEGSGTYTGDIIDGMKHDSSATFKFTNGYVYEGSFIHNQIDGFGKLTIPKVGVYEGNFSNGQRSGDGTMTFSNGDVYTGGWVNDQMSGSGTYTFANGDTYVGDFSENKFNGSGTYTFKSTGESYTGTWSNNSYKG